MRHQCKNHTKRSTFGQRKWNHSRKKTVLITDKKQSDAEEEIEILEMEIDDIKAENEKLVAENKKIMKQLEKEEEPNSPLLSFGKEPEFYPGETKDILISVLSDAASNLPSDSRRKDIIQSIVDENHTDALDKKAAEIKRIFKNYKNMSSHTKKALKKLGFNLTDDGKHYKATYYGDNRYMTTLSRTPGDSHALMNMAQTMITMAF